MSAVVDSGEQSHELINVLFALYPNMDVLQFAGPLEVFNEAQHNPNDPDTKAFECTFAAAEENTMAKQGCQIRAQISYKEAHKRLGEFDVLVVPGGDVLEIIKEKSEPLDLITAFAECQKKDPARERTLMSICTGSLLLAQQGVLAGLSATTHPDYYTKFENICSQAAQRDLDERTDVMEERYVVNHGRFDLGENLDENPYVYGKKSRRTSVARKGSNAWKESNKRRESNARRATMRLGGLRVITSGGPTSGMDASLYLVSAMVSNDCAKEVARLLQYDWIKGVVVDSLDV